MLVKVEGALAANSEMAEDSAAREGIRHMETWENLEIEDIHYGLVTYLQRIAKIIIRY
jgi:hypothetical protein